MSVNLHNSETGLGAIPIRNRRLFGVTVCLGTQLNPQEEPRNMEKRSMDRTHDAAVTNANQSKQQIHQFNEELRERYNNEEHHPYSPRHGRIGIRRARTGGTANAAPAGASSIDATVSQLRAQGLQVIVNRVGTAPLDQCTVNAVRPGQTFSRTDSGVPGDHLVTTVTNKTVYVDVVC